MGTGKQYDEEFKKQAIKLAKEIGTHVPSVPLGMHSSSAAALVPISFASFIACFLNSSSYCFPVPIDDTYKTIEV